MMIGTAREKKFKRQFLCERAFLSSRTDRFANG
jgi:hypothetical protein